jgi:hypothetical protein
MSPDGTKVAFSSAGNTHGPVDTDDGVLGLDVYVRDLTIGVTTLVSVNTAGTDSGNSISGAPQFAGNDKIAFASLATDLAPPDADTEADLFLRDLVSGTTTLLSASADGGRSGNGAVFPGASISADGSVITFATTGSNHGARDTNGFEDIYAVRYHDRADLAVTAEASPDPVAPGGELTYDVGVTNAGPESGEDGKVIVVLPEGTKLFDAEATGGACAQPIPERPDIVSCELGDLAAGSSAGAVIRAQVSAPPGSVLTAVVAAGAMTFDPVSTSDD